MVARTGQLVALAPITLLNTFKQSVGGSATTRRAFNDSSFTRWHSNLFASGETVGHWLMTSEQGWAEIALDKRPNNEGGQQEPRGITDLSPSESPKAVTASQSKSSIIKLSDTLEH